MVQGADIVAVLTEAGDLSVVAEATDKCLSLFAATAAKIVKFPLDQRVINRYTAVIASRKWAGKTTEGLLTDPDATILS